MVFPPRCWFYTWILQGTFRYGVLWGTPFPGALLLCVALPVLDSGGLFHCALAPDWSLDDLTLLGVMCLCGCTFCVFLASFIPGLTFFIMLPMNWASL